MTITISVPFSQFTQGTIPLQRVRNGNPFPLVLQPQSLVSKANVLDFFRENATCITEALNVHGAILFRGLPEIFKAKDFDDVLGQLGWKEYEYVSGAAPRTRIHGSIYTTNEGPSDTTISWHHEVSQSKTPPARIAFMCEEFECSGGQTCILDSNEAWRVLEIHEPEFIRCLVEFGIVYTRVLSENTNKKLNAGRGWKDTYNVTNKDDLKLLLNDLGVTAEWISDSEFKASSPVLPGYRKDDTTGNIAFFNSICGSYFDNLHAYGQGNITKYLKFGPNAPASNQLQEESLVRIYKRLDSIGIPIDWKAGDLLLIDNNSVAHSRRPYDNGPRKVYASLWN